MQPEVLLTDEKVNPDTVPACNVEGIVSCKKVDVNFIAFFTDDALEFPDGVVMIKTRDMGEIDDEYYSAYYEVEIWKGIMMLHYHP